LDWHLAHVKDGTLHAVNSLAFHRLFINAVVIAPTPGYEARVVQLPILIFPPQYAVEIRAKPGIWPDVVTDIPAFGVFPALANVREILVHTADGTKTVPVAIIPSDTREPALVQPSNQATGYAPGYDFDAAFQDAVDRLGPTVTPIDFITHVRVIKTELLTGGIVPMTLTSVTVERVTVPVTGPPVAEPAHA